MRHLVQCRGYELWRYDSTDEIPPGFLHPVYMVTSPDGVERTVSEDKLKDALDYAFELSA